MSILRALLDRLYTNKIPYEILPHAKAYTARMAAAAAHVPRRQQAKVVIVSSKKGPAMAVLPADRKLDLRKAQENHPRTGRLAERSGVRTSFC